MAQVSATELVESYARAIAAGESLGCDPDAPFPSDDHRFAKPRWQWHEQAARHVLAGLAFKALDG